MSSEAQGAQLPPPPPPPFRLACAADAPAVVRLVNSAYRGDSGRQGWTTESDYLDGQRLDETMFHTDILADESKSLLVLPKAVWRAEQAQPAEGNDGAADDGELIACVMVERLAKDPAAAAVYVGMVTVQPTAQGGGLGSKLLAAAEVYAVARFGARKAVMTVLEPRSELIAFYERRGYRRTGETEPFMYGEERFGIPKRDDLVFLKMEKEL
ncbi:hypothetical protein HK405_009681, partial [Cladochytrium tenue]